MKSEKAQGFKASVALNGIKELMLGLISIIRTQHFKLVDL